MHPKSNGLYELRIDQMDSTQTCCVKQRVQCSQTSGKRIVPAPEGDEIVHFALKVKVFKELLKTIPANDHISISRRERSCDVMVESLGDDRDRYIIKTLNVGPFCPVLIVDLKSCLSISFDTEKLKKIMRATTQIKASTLAVTVVEVSPSLLRVALDCQASAAKGLWRFDVQQGSPTIMHAEECDVDDDDDDDCMAQGATLYREVFNVDYISRFVKSMDQHRRAIIGMGTGQPMQIDFQLGAEDSSVTFILAPEPSDAAPAHEGDLAKDHRAGEFAKDHLAAAS